jgi:serine/threonine protein kinase
VTLAGNWHSHSEHRGETDAKAETHLADDTDTPAITANNEPNVTTQPHAHPQIQTAVRAVTTHVHARSATLMTKGIGTTLWMAPEMLAGQAYDASADVYSYAIVLWEVAAQARPWDEVNDTFLRDALLALIDGGQRPAVEVDWPADYVRVMRRCWAREPQQRPSFKAVLELLQGRA